MILSPADAKAPSPKFKILIRDYKVAVVERLDGDYEKTVERVIAANPAKLENLVDVETGEIISNEDLSEDEMREFDGDIDELEEIPTISKILGDTDKTEEQDETDDFDLQAERERLKAFDRTRLIQTNIISKRLKKSIMNFKK